MNKKHHTPSSFLQIFSTILLGASVLSFYSCKKDTPLPHVDKQPTIQKEIVASAKKIQKKVQQIRPPKKAKDNRRTIYLTFDDGPNRGTENVLEVIHEKKIPSTFFIVGKHVNDSKKQKKMMKRLTQDSLIEIANHSYTHANHKYNKFYKDKEGVLADFNRTKDTLQLTSPIARTPGRNIWRIPHVQSTDIKSSKEAADYLHDNGYKLVGWDLEWKHDTSMKLEANHHVLLKRVDSIFMNDLEKTSRHLVILTHDQYIRDDVSKNELSLFIDQLQKSNRFQFKKISEYPHIHDVLR